MKERLNDNLRLLGYAVTELKGMSFFFEGDNANNQVFRRILLKNFFSIIETYLFVSRQMVIIKSIVDGKESNLTWEEKSLLNEKRVGLSPNGEITVSDAYQNFIPSFRFTLSIFAKTFDSDMPDYSDINFRHLQDMVKRRNAITHPKSHLDLNITNEEIKILIPMLKWFINLHGRIDSGFRGWLETTYPKL